MIDNFLTVILGFGLCVLGFLILIIVIKCVLINVFHMALLSVNKCSAIYTFIIAFSFHQASIAVGSCWWCLV